MRHSKAGDQVFVCGKGWATFDIRADRAPSKSGGNGPYLLDDNGNYINRREYPHGKLVTLVCMNDAQTGWHIRLENGKEDEVLFCGLTSDPEMRKSVEVSNLKITDKIHKRKKKKENK